MASDDDPPSTTSKKQLDINFDELLSEDAGEPVPNVVVVPSTDRRRRRRPRNTPTETSTAAQIDCGELSKLSVDQLKEKISRLTNVLNSPAGLTLPDKGEKLKRQIAGFEEELERRNNSEVADECKEQESSRFAKRLLKNMGTDVKPNPDQNDDQNAAFQDEMPYINPGVKQKRNTGANLPPNKKAKSMFDSKEFATWNPKNGSQSRQKYDSSKGNLFSKPSAQEKLPFSVRFRNGINNVSSKCTNDDKEECTVVLVDEEEPDTTQKIEEPEKRRSRRNECKIFYPSREDPESLEIFRSELKCLEPGECLTSTIMNFYIRYLQQKCSMSDRSKFYFFNTYFYSKLQEAMAHENEETFFIKFRRWWKNVNIFEKTYIFLPVNDDKHWSLVILCISDEEDSGPIILHLDSLGLHYSHLIIKNVKSLLENEWKYLKGAGEAVDIPIPDTLKENLSQRIDGKTIEAPRQTNDYDCGLFVLYYIERFIEDAPEKMRDEYLSMFGKKWFKAQEASSLRSKIKTILNDEFRKIPTEDNSLWETVCLPSAVTRAKAAHLAGI